MNKTQPRLNRGQLPTNFLKHTSKNPIQRYLINNFYSSLVSLARPLSLKTILDAGCGEGFTMHNLVKNKIGQTVTGIEFSHDAIALGKKLFPTLNIKQGSAYDLPYKDNSVDLVVCTEVLEHLEDPKKVLKETLRVTKRYTIFSVPNEPFFMLSNFLRGKNLSALGNDPGHINHWTILSFQNFLKVNGVKIRKLKFPFPWILALVEKQQL